MLTHEEFLAFFQQAGFKKMDSNTFYCPPYGTSSGQTYHQFISMSPYDGEWHFLLTTVSLCSAKAHYSTIEFASRGLCIVGDDLVYGSATLLNRKYAKERAARKVVQCASI